MRVSDVKPTRMAAAQDAAKLFLKEVPRDVEVGLITFAGSTQVAAVWRNDGDAFVDAEAGLQGLDENAKVEYELESQRGKTSAVELKLL